MKQLLRKCGAQEWEVLATSTSQMFNMRCLQLTQPAMGVEVLANREVQE